MQSDRDRHVLVALAEAIKGAHDPELFEALIHAAMSEGQSLGAAVRLAKEALERKHEFAEPDERPRGQRIDTPEETEQSRREMEEADDSPPPDPAPPRTPA